MANATAPGAGARRRAGNPWPSATAPAVAAALDQYGDEIVFIGVPAKDSDEALHAFVAEYGLEQMPQAVDYDGSLWARFGVGYQPAWVFIGDDGTVETVAGALPGDGLTRRLEDLLAN